MERLPGPPDRACENGGLAPATPAEAKRSGTYVAVKVCVRLTCRAGSSGPNRPFSPESRGCEASCVPLAHAPGSHRVVGDDAVRAPLLGRSFPSDPLVPATAPLLKSSKRRALATLFGRLGLPPGGGGSSRGESAPVAWD